MVQSVNNQVVRWNGRQLHFAAHASANYAGLEAARLHPFIPPSLFLVVVTQYITVIQLYSAECC